MNAFNSKEEATDALVAELEASIFADLRRLGELKGEEYLKKFCADILLPF